MKFLYMYRKILISPGLIFAQKVFLLGLFSGELTCIFKGAYYWKEFCNSKQLTITVHRLIFGKAYYRKDNCICDLGGLFLGGLICLEGGLVIRLLNNKRYLLGSLKILGSKMALSTCETAKGY